MHDGVAQHVLERRQHALENLPVELAGRAADLKLGLLAHFSCRLAHDAREALHMALEWHHARAHQAALQLGDDTALLGQQVLRLACLDREQALHAGDVGTGLGQCARVLLNRRILVEFQWIEIVAARALIDVPVQDLGLGFDLELAQLVLQALHHAAEFCQVEIHGRKLLLESRAENADFACRVQHVVEEFGVDPRDFSAIRARIAARRSGGDR